MYLYSVLDNQCEVWSEPFLAASDAACLKLLLDTASCSDVFAARLQHVDVYRIGSYNPDNPEMPLDALKIPVIIYLGSDILNKRGASNG